VNGATSIALLSLEQPTTATPLLSETIKPPESTPLSRAAVKRVGVNLFGMDTGTGNCVDFNNGVMSDVLKGIRGEWM
jgi:hypothetical protein